MDSFQGSKGDPASLHKYTYAHCNPVNYSDPSGNYTLKEVLTVAFTIVSLALNVYSLGNNIVRFGYARTSREKILAGFAVGIDIAFLVASVFGSGFVRPGPEYVLSKAGEVYISLQLSAQTALELSAAIATISLAKILNIGSGGAPPINPPLGDPYINPADDVTNADLFPNVGKGEVEADATNLPTEWTSTFDRYSWTRAPVSSLNNKADSAKIAQEAFRVVKPGGKVWIRGTSNTIQPEAIKAFEEAGFVNVKIEKNVLTADKP